MRVKIDSAMLNGISGRLQDEGCIIVEHTNFKEVDLLLTDKVIPKPYENFLKGQNPKILIHSGQRLDISPSILRFLKDTTPTLCPFSIELWVKDGIPIYHYLGAIKQYKFLAGDLGVDTLYPESILMWSYPNRGATPFRRTLEQGLYKILEETYYTGRLALDGFVSMQDKCLFVSRVSNHLELGPLTCLAQLLRGPLVEFLVSFLVDKNPQILVKDQYAIAVGFSVPPYPNITGVQEDDRTLDISFNGASGNGLYHTYNKGFLGYVAANGNTWKEARNNVAPLIRGIDTDNLQYRVDAGVQGRYLNLLNDIGFL